MSADEIIRPFRWDVRRRSQLGSLPDVELPETYSGFEEDLLTCCARAVAFAGDADIIFIGRSPEALFDLLSGMLLETSWTDRLSLLNVSFREWAPPDGEQVRAISPYLEHLGLGPDQLLRRVRPVAFIDVVDTGDTFGSLIDLLHLSSERDQVEWRAVARKIRIVGITWREKTSPSTRRWQQHAEWVRLLRPQSIKNVSAPLEFASYLAAGQPKTSHSFPPPAWTDRNITAPLRGAEARTALALALHLFDFGRERATRLRFARELAEQPQVAESWFRSLILEIKR